MIKLIPRFSPDYSLNDIGKVIISNKHNVNLDKLSFYLFNKKNYFLLGNARSAIYAILSCLSPGEVILPSYICFTVPEAIKLSGHTPKFVDVCPETLCMPIENIRKAISPNTKAIIICHTFGIPCEVDEIVEISSSLNIVVIEDSAGALGASHNGKYVGTSGDAAVFSFNKGKPLFLGKGGFLIINNEMLQYKIAGLITSAKPSGRIASLLTFTWEKILRNPHCYHLAYRLQAIRKKGEFWENGSHPFPDKKNYLKLMDDVTKKLLLYRLRDYETLLKKRMLIAQRYMERINNIHVRQFHIPHESLPAWPCYPLLVEKRHEFFYHMKSFEIDLSWSWSYNIAEINGQKDCPNASYLAKRILSLPINTKFSDTDIDNIITAVNIFN